MTARLTHILFWGAKSGIKRINTANVPLRGAFMSYRLNSTMSVTEQFVKHGIVPDVISKAPEKELKVVFSGGQEAKFGNILTPTIVKDEPKLSWESKPDTLYTIVKTDPDAPSRKEPKFREWHHWLVINVKGNDVKSGETISEYIGAGPPEGTGFHRYVYLVYEQPSGQKISDPEHGHLTNKSGEDRANFKVAKFAEKHNLGTPIAGNFYQAEFDDYVPILYKQLSG